MPPLRRSIAVAALLFALPAAGAEDDCWKLALNEPRAAVTSLGRELSKGGRDLSTTAQLHACRGYAYEQLGDINKAFVEYEAAVSFGQRSGNKESWANALALLGQLRHYRGEFSAAIEDLQKAYALHSELGNEGDVVYALNAIANLYADRRVGAYDRAIEYYRQVLLANEKKKNAAGIATAHYNIGATLDTKGDHAAALVEFRRALELEQARKDPDAVADVRRALGITLGKLDRNEEALRVLDQALDYFVKAREEESAAAVRLARGTVLRKLGRAAEAARELESARRRFESSKSNRFLEKAHDERAMTYADLGDWRSAYVARSEQLKVREALGASQSAEHVSRLRVQFETEKKEQENRGLLRENALRSRALEDAARIRKLQAAVIALSAVVVAFLIVVARRMRALAMTDELTKLPNRRRVLTVADERLRAARSRGGKLSLLALDIDHFKKINDAYGHDAGDIVLRRVSNACRRALRRGDEIGRTGGEEFLVVLPDTDGTTAAEIAERLRAAVERIDVNDIHSDLRITISVGVTEWHSTDDFTATAKRADDLLYLAKQSGRNRVVFA